MRRDEGEEFWQKLECGKRNCGIHDGPPMLFGIGFSQLYKTRKSFESRLYDSPRRLLAGNITGQMTTLTSFGKLCLHRPNIFREEVIMK